jgi:biopolymer transport protein ExbD
MAMSMGAKEEDGLNNEINTTPLVDVMLVLLIIFLITVPVALQTAPVELPKVTNTVLETKPENIIVGADKDGNLYWNAARLDGGKTELFQRLKTKVEAVVKNGGTYEDLPEVHIRADKDVNYEHIGGIIITTQRAGVPKVAFISEPNRPGSGG